MFFTNSCLTFQLLSISSLRIVYDSLCTGCVPLCLPTREDVKTGPTIVEGLVCRLIGLVVGTALTLLYGRTPVPSSWKYNPPALRGSN